MRFEFFKKSLSEQVQAKKPDEGDPSIEAVLESPEVLSHTTILYQLPGYGGRELRPGKKILFVVPGEFKGRVVRDVVLLHRKAEKYAKNIGTDGYDPHGAYSEVKILDNKTNQWRSWVDPAGYDPIKFAEPRSSSDPENEVLHDWIATVGEINPDAIEVKNVGKDVNYSVSQIHGLEVTFFPEAESTDFKERIYCSGTSFIDLESGRTLPDYGGGEHTRGIYKGAVQLGGYGGASFETSEPGPEAERRGSQLALKLEAGREVVQIEVSVGDTEHRTDKVRLGWAKLWIGVRKAKTGQVEWFVKNANVPPQGVISGGPHLDKNKVEEGDELIIESRADTAYIMGWRLAYEK